MRILIVAATEFEVGRSEVGSRKSESQSQESRIRTIEFLITGVGMVATAFALGKHLAANQYDLVINLGIAGSFDRSIALGEVVEVTGRSFFPNWAQKMMKHFLPIETIGLWRKHF